MAFPATCSMALRRAALALVLGAACQGAPPPPHGSPVLTHVYWIAGDLTALVWTPDGQSNPQIASSAPPHVNEIDFVFDRRLDGALVEDLFTEGGVLMTKPKDDPPVHVVWPNMAATMPSGEPFRFVVQYNSLPTYGGESSYVLGRPAKPGLPAGTTVAFELDLSRLANSYGEPALAPTKIPVKTAPFALSVSVPATAISATFQVPLVFNNRVPAAPSTSPFIHVRAGGADVPYKLFADATMDSRWYVGPADCLGSWPASTTYTLTIDAGLADVFGGKLAEAVTATFKTGSASSGGADCGVTPSSDGGADAPVEAAPDAPGEAAPDAPAESAPDAGAEVEPDGGADDVSVSQ
jgi:Bacterial Ig-like domain